MERKDRGVESHYKKGGHRNFTLKIFWKNHVGVVVWKNDWALISFSKIFSELSQVITTPGDIAHSIWYSHTGLGTLSFTEYNWKRLKLKEILLFLPVCFQMARITKLLTSNLKRTSPFSVSWTWFVWILHYHNISTLYRKI